MSEPREVSSPYRSLKGPPTAKESAFWAKLSAGWIYFIRSGHGTPVKIGFTGPDTLECRLAQLQTGHPYKLYVTAKARGSIHDERTVHRIFATDRLQGEWFKSTPRLVAFMNRLEAGESLPKVVADEMTDRDRRPNWAAGY